ncbi:hypothetical protein WA588_000009 [Blastocystis sp. NMH]
MIDLSFRRVASIIDNIRFIHVFHSVSLTTFVSSLFVCESVRKSRKNAYMTWIESLLMCFLGQFGGTVISSLLLGEPMYSLTADSFVLGLLGAWLVINWTPFDWGIKAFQHPLVRSLNTLFRWLSVSYAITVGGVDNALKADPSLLNTSGTLLLSVGTIAGCGGTVFLRYLELVPEGGSTPSIPIYETNVTTSKLPVDLIRPTFTVKRSFFATILYLYLLDPFHLIRDISVDPMVARSIVFLFVAGTSILRSLGWNVFDSVSRVFHGVTQIPKEIPVFAQQWSFEEIQEKAKEM